SDFACSLFHLSLHSFPTRRSSDLSILCVALISWQSWVVAEHSVSVREVSAEVSWFLIYPWKIAFALGFTIVLLEIVRQAISSALDRKSTRLNSSHVKISYAVFCLK